MNPTPVAWFCEDESTLSFAEMKGCACVPLFTEAQLRQAKVDALREAADEACRSCDKKLWNMAAELEKP